MNTQSLDEKFAKVREALRERGRLVVAFSGGVDSVVLAHLAMKSADVVCVFVKDETTAEDELIHARNSAGKLGAKFQVLEHSTLDEEFCKNTITRCYHCKKSMIQLLKEFAKQNGIEWIAMGVTTSDFMEYRPGIRAGYEEGVWYPFVEFGISKEDVRAYAKNEGLDVAERPSNACLASRVAYNQKITPDLLEKIAEGERYIRMLGFRVVRVRVHGNDARIEVGKNEIEKILNIQMLSKISAHLHNLGFVHVSLDVDGYRPGSMNEGITQPSLGTRNKKP